MSKAFKIVLMVCVIVLVFSTLMLLACRPSYLERLVETEDKLSEVSSDLWDLQWDYDLLKSDYELLESYVLYLETLLDENGIPRH